MKLPATDPGTDMKTPSKPATIALVIVAVVMFGSLAATGGYALFLRSNGYRSKCAASLTGVIGLPSEIGRVVPRSRSSSEFEDVIVWLPGKRGRALSCRRAIVTDVPTPEDPQRYDILLSGGTCEISTRTWLQSDYRGVFASGLRPGFAPDGPRRVTFGSMDVAFERNGFRAVFRDAGGYVDFEDRHRGQVSIICNKLNEYGSTAPLHLTAEIVPSDDGVRIDRLDLNVPHIPLEALNVGELTGAAVCNGTFSGRLSFSEQPEGDFLTLAGTCADLALPDLTAGLSPGPWRGRCPKIEVQELRVENGVPTRLQFSGRVESIEISDILATFGLPAISGTVTFDVGAAELERESIVRLVASGEALGIPVEELTGALAEGSMSGTLHVRIHDLTIEGDRLRSLDAVVEVGPAADGSNWIEGALLMDLVRRMSIELPSGLNAFGPQRIGFARLGARFEVRDEQLYVYGTHGDRNEAILTVRLFGREFVAVREQKRSFDLRPQLDRLRENARAAVSVRTP
jgi:hypothetical protein